jgi:hypothetical protein
MTELSRFETRWRARLDDATIFGTLVVDAARKSIRLRHVQSDAPLPIIFHEPKEWRSFVHVCVFCKQFVPQAIFIALAEMHRLGTMMTASSTRDAIGAIGIRRSANGIHSNWS